MRPTTIATITLLAAACTGSEEATRVEVPVGMPGAPGSATRTNLGYDVSIHRMRIAVSGIQFTIEGEEHADVSARVATPPPHPGHSAGGEVTGELPGDFILVWEGSSRPAPFGMATMIVGEYRGANFTFRAAGAGDALGASDPLLGHTFHIEGSIAGNAGGSGTVRSFDAVLDVEPFSEVVGATLDVSVGDPALEALLMEFEPINSVEGSTAFDDLDFFALPTTGAGDIVIRPGSDAHNVLRRKLQTHDHYGVGAFFHPED